MSAINPDLPLKIAVEPVAQSQQASVASTSEEELPEVNETNVESFSEQVSFFPAIP